MISLQKNINSKIYGKLLKIQHHLKEKKDKQLEKGFCLVQKLKNLMNNL